MTDKNRDFSKFKVAIRRVSQARAPLNDRSYSRWGYRNNERLGGDFTLDEILEIIQSGDQTSLQELSHYYYRTNSNYRNNIDYLAHLSLYESAVIPIYQEGKGSDTAIVRHFYDACDFIDKLDLPNTLAHILTYQLLDGVFNGILREDEGNFTIQDLPNAYCRSRFKDFNNLNILEFNLMYFEHITDEQMRLEAIRTYPKSIQQGWAQWVRHELISPWIPVPAAEGGMCFMFSSSNTIPLLIASIPELKKLDDAFGREKKRDENELYKLLIQRMPVDNKGELVFQLDEVADIHASVADMLQDIDTVDVLTTFGETDLESLQDSSSETQSSNRIDKYSSNAWSALGRGKILFNAENSSTLAYQIKKDEALMSGYWNLFERWIKYQINIHFAQANLCFDFQLLPITVFNRSDLQQVYFRGAQYGYSKMIAGVAMGITQRDQLSLMHFENDILGMSARMIPLQSSYTTSGQNISDEEKSAQNATQSTQIKDITNTTGRPELPDEQKSEKTQANIAAMG